jgi:hypothetical protein
MVDSLTKSQLIKLVGKIIAGDYDTEEDVNAMIFLLESNVPDPEVVNLIKKSDFFTPEQIVEKAMSYKPICL